ncbi:MAG: PIN domain-containing protein [Nitrospirales bacterium]|nr:PIN domain-containing protein [Nitrospira sp.]MDR4500961.1 PIN domain-containing protein [Nitrospirales bacterium]
MQPKGLIDTGPIVALLDRGDRWHKICVETFSSLPLPLATTSAVLAELFHFLDDHPQRIAAAWQTLRSGAITVLPITDQDMPALERLMKQYEDRPMDFADATLVHLAKRESLTTIFTIDHNDFETYRISGKQKFYIVPSR